MCDPTYPPSGGRAKPRPQGEGLIPGILTDGSEVRDFLNDISNLALNRSRGVWYQGRIQIDCRPLHGRLNAIGHFLSALGEWDRSPRVGASPLVLLGWGAGVLCADGEGALIPESALDAKVFSLDVEPVLLLTENNCCRFSNPKLENC